MVCKLSSRKSVSSVVIDAIVTELKKPGVTEKTRIDRDLGLSPKAARLRLYDPVADAIVAAGCTAKFLLRAHFQEAKRVKNIVDKAWASVEKGLKRAEDQLAVETASRNLRAARMVVEESEQLLSEVRSRIDERSKADINEFSDEEDFYSSLLDEEEDDEN